jgi:N,N-dimethylformamidase
MVRRLTRVVAAAALLAVVAADVRAQSISSYPIVGYADRWTVQPGDTLKVMVSTERRSYRADLVKLIHGDTNPIGPGFKETTLPSSIAGKEYPGRFQPLPHGSYAIVADAPALGRTGSFTLTAWIAASTPARTAQGILSKWSDAERSGYAMVLETDGSLGLWIGDGTRVEKVRTAKPLRAAVPSLVWAGGNQMANTTHWYFVAASYDAAASRVTLYQQPLADWPLEPTRAEEQRPVTLDAVGKTEAPFLIAAFWRTRDPAAPRTTGHFNGKIEAPRLFGRALSRDEIEGIKRGAASRTPDRTGSTAGPSTCRRAR